MSHHSLFRLSAEVYNTPHLITPQSIEPILDYLDSRNYELASFSKLQKESSEEEFIDAGNKIAVIPLMGTTTYRETMISSFCGLTSYEGMLQKAQESIAAGVTKIVLEIDSGGGSAQGCFSSANEFRKICTDAGVTVYGYVDGSCCSAALAWGVICDELISDKYSNIGSLGVLVAMSDTSEKDAKEGVRTIYVTDGASKIPFDSEGKFKSDFLEELQEKVSYLGDEFRSHVESYTGIPVKTLKDTQAKVYMAQEALDIGFINKIMTKSEFISYVVNKKEL